MRFLQFALAVLLVQAVLAQDRPDFSGEWVRLAPPEGPPPVLTIVQDEQTIRIQVRSSGGPSSSSGTYGVGTLAGWSAPFPEKCRVSSGPGKAVRLSSPGKAGE